MITLKLKWIVRFIFEIFLSINMNTNGNVNVGNVNIYKYLTNI